MSKPAVIVVPSTDVPVYGQTKWWESILEWFRLHERRPAVHVRADGLILVNPVNVEKVAQILREEGYPVVTGHYKNPAAPREPWAMAPKPSQSLAPTPRVTKPKLGVIPGGKA